jgi:hypothetical protein
MRQFLWIKFENDIGILYESPKISIMFNWKTWIWDLNWKKNHYIDIGFVRIDWDPLVTHND